MLLFHTRNHFQFKHFYEFLKVQFNRIIDNLFYEFKQTDGQKMKFFLQESRT